MIQTFTKRFFQIAAGAVLIAGSGMVHAAGSVSFLQPANGATVTSPVHLKFAVSGMRVAPAGDMSEGTGHHHLLIDGGPVPTGDVVPANDHAIHYGKGQTETDVVLPPGAHTLTLQFADGAHRSYGPAMSQTIKVDVK
ncbi:DUF4399 domain-containing protein [Paraburkholderia sp. NMBU_R16]|uniref:DUF4399 domain-containing protein n=1 Tax=Paraburkholderia sp. NMBU_R16 TaxID=2698676 RepID=UPI0015644F7F|nr:DUF4399 domain-containing protein [Paraburkholderia sp. NMBU_R16]NRO99463.1 DUF4399 domain-containing protein [Paraburkholderia sp. NMBU_R16]